MCDVNEIELVLLLVQVVIRCIVCRSSNVSALSELEVCLNNQDLLLLHDFDPREITDDRQAKAIINRIYSMTVDSQYLIDTGSANLSDTGLEFNFSINSEFDLFLCMVLLNRPELARLFWVLDGRKRTASMFQSALLACLLCRNLMKLPYVHQHYHLEAAFAHIASYYENFASRVLFAAHSRNAERTLTAIGQKLQQCRDWSSLDIIVLAECEKLVEHCDSLCIAAVKRRFWGQQDLVSTFPRLYNAWTSGFVELCKAIAPSSSSSTSKGFFERKQSFRLRRKSSMKDKKVTAESVTNDDVTDNWWVVFMVCIMIDFVSILHFISPFLPLVVSILWAPVSAWMVFYLHGNSLMSCICLIEELVPFLNTFPTATLTLIWTTGAKGIGPEEDTAYLPVDYFVLDATSHLALTFTLTHFILLEQSIWANMLEVLIVMVFIFDEVPDVLFAGVTAHSTSMTSVLVVGFAEYWSSTGYVPSAIGNNERKDRDHFKSIFLRDCKKIKEMIIHLC